MLQLALNIHMQDRMALVVGGGRVAGRKISSLLAAGVRVRVVACQVLPSIQGLAAEGRIGLRMGAYEPEDLDGIFLVVAATDNAAVNAQVADDAGGRGLLVSVVDAPELGTCTFPAVLRRGSLEVAVSTGGACPSFAVHVRDIIGEVIGEEYGNALERLAMVREKLLTQGNGSTYNAGMIRASVQSEIARLLDNEGKP